MNSPHSAPGAAAPLVLDDRLRLLASVSLVALIIVCVAWETVLAPLRPGGSWLVLKALPLLLPLRGVLKGRLYTMQWASMLILLYLMEGVVRGLTDTTAVSAWLGWAETALSAVFFGCAVLYVSPSKRAAKARAAAQKLAARAQQAGKTVR